MGEEGETSETFIEEFQDAINNKWIDKQRSQNLDPLDKAFCVFPKSVLMLESAKQVSMLSQASICQISMYWGEMR